MTLVKKLETTAAFLKEKLSNNFPQTIVVLGSGFQSFADLVDVECVIPLNSIPNVLAPTVAGHGKDLIVGMVKGERIGVVTGRVHLYEGHPINEVVFPIRAFAKAGMKRLVLTNAAGSATLDIKPGSVILLKDHLNMTGENCLIGEAKELGPLFLDMGQVYDRKWKSRLASLDLREGVYAGLKGPTYETPAETRMIGSMGADIIGMSTVQEAIAAHQLGVKVIALSFVTNFCGGLEENLKHEDVLAIAQRERARLGEVLSNVVSV